VIAQNIFYNKNCPKSADLHRNFLGGDSHKLYCGRGTILSGHQFCP